MPVTALAFVFGATRIRYALAAALVVALGAGGAAAERLGYSLAISNDSIGEFKDRWQSSSVQGGLFFGEPWEGEAPDGFGDLVEFRLRSDILTPADLDDPAPGDRRHAGVMALGAHAYLERRDIEMRLGADVVFVGEQTGLLSFQEGLHRLLGFEIPELDEFQIEDQTSLDLSAELGRTWQLGEAAVRPFVTVQTGSEDLVRLGADLTWGALARGALLTRALATGQRVPAIAEEQGLSVMLGADVAYVDESIYLPESLGYDLTPLRTRLRGGVHLKQGRFDVFYGLAYLGKEFEAQPEGQFVGTFQARIDF